MLKALEKVPKNVQSAFEVLARSLRDEGPVQPSWPNYGKLGADRYHCHLKRKWVAVWTHESCGGDLCWFA